ncbi:dUTP diphosphatase [Acetilactobacillus jinshanensis]|uniref:dUTP diphosphatase n=1 Tax=Acetilactobacillus jinshanensis TaxID=1720083 RepID=A0A4P6ZLZ4_9LACO|nr:dUTP diphosphatase [Acetilactobacillus jinshanensis]QBP18856.1 dUTP diphosphatase [Acetilactobacillus jinshanensis]URL61723.1 dUTP diphosphatase [uncultured bacterium]
MKRGFQIVSKYKNQGIKLPKRATQNSAGYDFASAVDMTLPSIWKLNFLKVLWAIHHQDQLTDDQITAAKKVLKPYLIPTGIKAYMQPNEVLIIANRSSNPLKRGMILPNGIGVIDSDYYNNPSNEGEIFVQMVNFGIRDRKIHKGDRIGQGIFMPYLIADHEIKPKAKRQSGFGSTGK